MLDFELLASTTRAGTAVDEVEFSVRDSAPARGYLLGGRTDGPQPCVLALHDERGDKATLLPDLAHLAARGFLCLSLDSPVTRRAAAARDPLTAFDTLSAIATAAFEHLVQDPAVMSTRLALLGRGMGAEVAAALASTTESIRVVVGIAPLLDRSDFIDRSSHPLAAGLRQFHDAETIAHLVGGLRPKRLVDQLERSTHTHWMLHMANDDDRLSDHDRATLSVGIPRTVRVDHVSQTSDLWSRQARRSRVNMITQFCG